MLRRKVLAASARLIAAAERRDSNKVRFVRRLLLRRRVHVPEFGLECFRGTKVYVTGTCKVAGCKVALVKGCGRCYDAEVAFNRLANGGSDVVFNCRESTAPKLWVTTKRLGKVPGTFVLEPMAGITPDLDELIIRVSREINRPTR